MKQKLRAISRRKAVKYFTREWNGMEASLNSYFVNGEPDDLHHFRTHFKKLLGFLRLWDYCRAHPGMVRHFKSVKKISKRAGELRNAFVCQAFDHSQHPDKELIQDFHSHQDKYWCEIKKSYCELIGKIKPVKAAPIAKFYHNQLRQLARALKASPSDGGLHECRKRLKVLLGNQKLVRNSLPVRINVKYLDLLQETIGNWHDRTLMLAYFNDDPAIITKLCEQQSQLRVDLDRLVLNFYRRATHPKKPENT